MGKGITVNCSMIEQNGEYEIGVNYTDSDGVDINLEKEGEDLDLLLEEVAEDIIVNYLKQTAKLKAKEEEESDEEVEENSASIAELQKIIEDLKNENNSLKIDNAVLQQRADDAVNKNTKKKTPKVNGRFFVSDPFERFLRVYF